jgi:glycosyltransferase involved in cell wall biosynthesis
MRVLVVIPALNEEASLAPLIKELHGLDVGLDSVLEMAVIDDGSMDRTAQTAASSGARVVRLCRNLGIGGAVQTGLRIALRENFDCAIQIDGDGQHPPLELEKLLARLRSEPAPDLIVGSRYTVGTGFNSTRLRRLGSRWLRWLLRIITGLRITDPTSGYRLYGPRSLALFEQTYPYDYPEPEALAIAQAAGLQIAEVPVVMRERQGGRSSIAGWAAPYYMLKVSLAVVLSYLRHRGRLTF